MPHAHAVLTSYGVSKRDFFRLLSSNPRLFTQGSLFNAGSIMAWLQVRGLGRCPWAVVRVGAKLAKLCVVAVSPW